MTIRASVEEITRPVAQHLLDNMAINRTLRQKDVEKYAGAMNRGQFKGENGETIIINADGLLIDGQHRLRGFLATNLESIKLLVVTGATDPDSINQGRSRTPADVLAMHGYRNVFALAAAARWLYVYENSWPTGLRGQRSAVTIESTQEIVKEHSDLCDAVDTVVQKYRKTSTLLTPSVASFVRVVTNRIDGEKSDQFLQALDDGIVGAPETKTLHTLRERLLIRNTRSGHLTGSDIVVLCVRSWNALREGRELTRLVIGKNLEDPYINTPRFL